MGPASDFFRAYNGLHGRLFLLPRCVTRPTYVKAGHGIASESLRGRRTDMMPKFALSMLVALAACAPLQEAAAQESTLGGALFGGAAGAIVGGAIGGGRGAAIGAIVGAGTGAAIGAQGEPRGGGYRY